MQIFANCVGCFPCMSFYHLLLTMRGRKQLTGSELRADWNWNWNWLRVLRREDESSFRWAERKTISEHCQLRLQEGSAGVLVCVCVWACLCVCRCESVCAARPHPRGHVWMKWQAVTQRRNEKVAQLSWRNEMGMEHDTRRRHDGNSTPEGTQY